MKKQNWFIQLAQFIESRRHSPFVWGENDCCLFVADAVQLISGIDAAAPFRNKYSTAVGAARALKKYGDGSIAGAWSACFDEISPQHMGRGDVALVEVQGAPASALSFGNKLWVLSENGLITLPRSQAVRAWKV